MEEKFTISSCEVTLTSSESRALAQEFDEILREFSNEGYQDRIFTNPIKAKALNKVYSTLTGEVHFSIVANFKKFSDQYYRAAANFSSLDKMREIDEKNIPTMSMKINVEGEEKQVLFNSLEEEYLKQEIELLKNCCTMIIGFKYRKQITDEVTISSINKIYNAIMNKKKQMLDSVIYTGEEKPKKR